jgi:hypothetical protein
VRTLARLWQLQSKMQTVGGEQGTAYEARIERVCAVAGGIEERLAKRLELLDGYARVMNMIEIEVEMDMQVGGLVGGLGPHEGVCVFGGGCSCGASTAFSGFVQGPHRVIKQRR